MGPPFGSGMKCGGCTVDDDALADGGEGGALLQEAPATICPARARTGRRTRSESGDCERHRERHSICGSPAPQVALEPPATIGGSEGNFANCYMGSRSQRSSLVEPRWSSFKETSVHLSGRVNGGANIVVQPEGTATTLSTTTKVIGKEVRADTEPLFVLVGAGGDSHTQFSCRGNFHLHMDYT